MPLCANTHCATTQPGILLPLGSKPLFLVLPSWFLFASRLAYLDSSPPIIKLPKLTRDTRFRPLHGAVETPSETDIIHSTGLRTQKPASRRCSPNTATKNLLRCLHLPWCLKQTPLSPPKAARFMVLMLSEQILLNGTGKWLHFPWLMGGRIPESPWKWFREMSGY